MSLINDINRVFVSGQVLGAPVVKPGNNGRSVLLQVVSTHQAIAAGEQTERKEMHQVIFFPPLCNAAVQCNEGDRVVVEGQIRYKDLTRAYVIATRIDKLTPAA